jgi:hypothetical protein
LVFELAVVHEPANRGCCGGCNFNQINIQLSCHAQGICQRNDSKGFVLGSGQTDLRESDFTVQAMLTLFALTAVTKFSGSDGSNPLKNNCTRQH